MIVEFPTFDSTEFKILDFASPGSSKRSVTAQGFLLIEDCKLAKSGVFTYTASNFQPHAFNDRNPTDPIRVFRSKETIEKAALGFSGAPVTDNHPIGGAMLDPSNTKKFQKGHVNGNVRVEDGVMIGDIIVTDRNAIANVNNGKDQLSNGYFSKYTFTAGVSPDGENFDCEQFDIRPNHVAIVLAGRNGPECRMSDSIDKPPKEEKPMAIVTLNGVSYEATEQVAQAVGVLQTTLDTANKKLSDIGDVEARVAAAVTAKTTEMQTTLDTKDAEIDKLKADFPNADKLEEMATERADVVLKAKDLAPKVELSGKAISAIKAEVVLDCCDDLKTLDGKSEDYITARFDGLTVNTKKVNKGNKALGDAFSNKDGEDEMSESEKARIKATDRKKAMGMRKAS